MARYLLVFDSYGLVLFLWREDGSVFCICCWPLAAHRGHILLSQIWDFPFRRLLRLALLRNGSSVLLWPGADRRQNTHLNISSVVICVSVATVMRVHQTPLSSNGLFRVARGMCSAKRRPVDGHSPAFRRHVTVFTTERLVTSQEGIRSMEF
jgi:hypothetical protein